MTSSKRIPYFFNIIIKLAFVLLFGYLLYLQIFAKKDIKTYEETFVVHFTGLNILWIATTVIMMPLNWALETMKWRQLVGHVEYLSFWKSYKAVIVGVALSIFTPNRIGEYGGRMLFVRPENQLKTVIATLVGTFSQWLILVSMGYLGLLYFMLYYWQVNTYYIQGIIFLAVLLIGLMLFGYFNIDIVAREAKKIPFLRRFKRFVKHINILKSFSEKELARVLLFSFLRYAVYTFQYYFLLRFFGIDVPFFAGLSCIATVFLLQTSIPLDPFTGLLVRGEIALMTWRMFHASDISILASTFSLWIINLIIPSFIGIIFIISMNIVKSLGYERTV